MKRLCPLFARLFVLVLCCLPFGSASAQTVDVSAALRYWEITDALRQDQPLTDAVWNEFLEMPANKRYVRSVFSAEDLKRYRRAVEVAYMPRHDSLLQAKLKAKAWYYVLANEYKQREAEYKRYIAETAKKPAYLDVMYTRAYEYLPRRAHTKVQNLQLAYIALGNDAISESAGLVFSLKSAIDANIPKAGILEGHEIHHQLRPGLVFQQVVAEQDQPLIWALMVMQVEGTADLIDKKVQLATKTDSADIYNWALAGAPAAIHKLDSVMQAAAQTGAALPDMKYYRRLFKGSTGHMPGFHMARTIENNGYGPQMLEHIEDPFAFFALYQKAAKKDKTHPALFSDASVKYVKSLEKKYLAKMRAATKALLAQSKPS